MALLLGSCAESKQSTPPPDAETSELETNEPDLEADTDADSSDEAEAEAEQTPLDLDLDEDEQSELSDLHDVDIIDLDELDESSELDELEPDDSEPDDSDDGEDGVEETVDQVDEELTPWVCPYDTVELPIIAFSTVLTGQTYAEASDLVQFDSELCGDNPDSAERVYLLEIAERSEVYVETRCSDDCELVITGMECDAASMVACAATIADESFLGELEAGLYYIFVEGDNPDDVGDFDLMVNIHRTGGQTPCLVDATLDVMDPALCEDPWLGTPRFELLLENQVLAPSDRDDFYAQGVFDCTSDGSHIGGAPDKVYAFSLSGGPHDIDIAFDADGWDGMIYLTTDPCGSVASMLDCIDSVVFSETLSMTLEAGTYYLVVDGFGEEVFDGDAWGSYSLEFLVFDELCNE
jgi:hypothetical protein